MHQDHTRHPCFSVLHACWTIGTAQLASLITVKAVCYLLVFLFFLLFQPSCAFSQKSDNPQTTIMSNCFKKKHQLFLNIFTVQKMKFNYLLLNSFLIIFKQNLLCRDHENDEYCSNGAFSLDSEFYFDLLNLLSCHLQIAMSRLQLVFPESLLNEVWRNDWFWPITQTFL